MATEKVNQKKAKKKKETNIEKRARVLATVPPTHDFSTQNRPTAYKRKPSEILLKQLGQ